MWHMWKICEFIFSRWRCLWGVSYLCLIYVSVCYLFTLLYKLKYLPNRHYYQRPSQRVVMKSCAQHLPLMAFLSDPYQRVYKLKFKKSENVLFDIVIINEFWLLLGPCSLKSEQMPTRYVFDNFAENSYNHRGVQWSWYPSCVKPKDIQITHKFIPIQTIIHTVFCELH